MVTRITRGRLMPNNEGQVFDRLRLSAAAQPTIPGLQSMSLSRTLQGRDTVLVAITIWDDVEAMARVLGPTWREPSWPAGLKELVAEATVEILETVAASAQELRDLSPTA